MQIKRYDNCRINYILNNKVIVEKFIKMSNQQKNKFEKKRLIKLINNNNNNNKNKK